MLDDAQLLLLLRMDLQRTGNIANDDEYLLHLVKAARESLARQGLRAEDSEAWLYRKRVNGEAEPKFLRRMRLDLIVSQQAGRT